MKNFLNFLVLLSFLHKSAAVFNADEVNHGLYSVEVNEIPISVENLLQPAGEIENEQEKVDKPEVPSDGENLILSSRFGQKFTCKIPIVSYGKHTEDAVLFNLTNANITSALNTTFFEYPCLKKTVGWWTYEFCFGQDIAQFHMEGSEISGDVISLGRFESEQQWIPESKTEESTTSAKRSVVAEHHSQLYTNGSLCELNTQLRKTTVQFFCEEDLRPSDAYIYRVDEPSSCQYVLIVHVGSLCQYPAFLPRDKPREPQQITCQPLLTAQQLQQYEAVQMEKKRKAEEEKEKVQKLKEMMDQKTTEEEKSGEKKKVSKESVQELVNKLEAVLELAMAKEMDKVKGETRKKTHLVDMDLNLFQEEAKTETEGGGAPVPDTTQPEAAAETPVPQVEEAVSPPAEEGSGEAELYLDEDSEDDDEDVLAAGWGLDFLGDPEWDEYIESEILERVVRAYRSPGKLSSQILIRVWKTVTGLLSKMHALGETTEKEAGRRVMDRLQRRLVKMDAQHERVRELVEKKYEAEIRMAKITQQGFSYSQLTGMIADVLDRLIMVEKKKVLKEKVKEDENEAWGKSLGAETGKTLESAKSEEAVGKVEEKETPAKNEEMSGKIEEKDTSTESEEAPVKIEERQTSVENEETPVKIEEKAASTENVETKPLDVEGTEAGKSEETKTAGEVEEKEAEGEIWNRVRVKVKKLTEEDPLPDAARRKVNAETQNLEHRLSEKLKKAGFQAQGRQVQVKVLTSGYFDEGEDFHILSEEESEQFSNMIISILAGETEQQRAHKRNRALETAYSFQIDKILPDDTADQH